eukprot:gene4328-7250_t
MPLPGFSLPHEVVLAIAKLILKLLRTKETFEEFFDSIPSFRPEAFQGFGSSGAQHYPDEMVVGLRRLGVECRQRHFELASGSAVGGAQFAAAAVLTRTGFLQTVWAVWDRLLSPAFTRGADWGFRAGQTAALCISHMRLALNLAAEQCPTIEQACPLVQPTRPARSSSPLIQPTHSGGTPSLFDLNRDEMVVGLRRLGVECRQRHFELASGSA